MQGDFRGTWGRLPCPHPSKPPASRSPTFRSSSPGSQARSVPTPSQGQGHTWRWGCLFRHRDGSLRKWQGLCGRSRSRPQPAHETDRRNHKLSMFARKRMLLGPQTNTEFIFANAGNSTTRAVRGVGSTGGATCFW